MDIREDTSTICNHCRKGDHERCPMIMAGNGLIFCGCKCSGETSLGAPPGAFEKPSNKVRKELHKFPKHEVDPLADIF